MNTFFDFGHRFKRSMLEITSDTDYDTLWKYLNPLQTEKLPDNITFRVAAGKKAYDIIRLYESGEEFHSQKVIDVLSQFVDMTDKCYPIKVEGVEEQYYFIYNLHAYPYLNRKENFYLDKPCFYGIENSLIPISGIEGTRCIIVSEEIKDALLKNKVTNIELRECFGCSKEEYKKIKKSKFVPQIRVYNDK